MKKMLILLSVILSTTAFAGAKCSDKNFVGLEAESYDKLQYHNRFVKLFEGDSPAPLGFADTFGPDDSPCRAVMVTYLKHVKTQKVYAMYTTHDDYCDGGNTIGLVIDTEKYSSLNNDMKDAVVGEIGDSEFYCN